MTAHLHLYNSAFTHKPSVTKEQLGVRIEALAILRDELRSDEDIVYRHVSIYDVHFFKGLSLATVLYSKDDNILSQDQRRALIKIIDHSRDSPLAMTDIVDRLDTHDENNIYGLICLHETNNININKTCLIYCVSDWVLFHRYFLGVYPISEVHFVMSCRKYFNKLFFHDRIAMSLETLEKGLKGFAKEIVRSLVALNDEFRNFYNAIDRVESLKRFSAACNVDATPEGSAARKKELTFDFKNVAGNLEQVCCEPHIKLSKSDDSGDTHHYFNRIYFHEGKPNIASGKLLVGHIGRHL